MKIMEPKFLLSTWPHISGIWYPQREGSTWGYPRPRRAIGAGHEFPFVSCPSRRKLNLFAIKWIFDTSSAGTPLDTSSPCLDTSSAYYAWGKSAGRYLYAISSTITIIFPPFTYLIEEKKTPRYKCRHRNKQKHNKKRFYFELKKNETKID